MIPYYTWSAWKSSLEQLDLHYAVVRCRIPAYGTAIAQQSLGQRFQMCNYLTANLKNFSEYTHPGIDQLKFHVFIWYVKVAHGKPGTIIFVLVWDYNIYARNRLKVWADEMNNVCQFCNCCACWLFNINMKLGLTAKPSPPPPSHTATHWFSLGFYICCHWDHLRTLRHHQCLWLLLELPGHSQHE